MSKEGYVKLHRKILSWEWYADRNVRDLFLHILLSAAFAPVSIRGVSLKPGQLITSLGKLSEGTGLSVQQTRTALSKLQSTGEITVEITNRFSIITVVNWGLYQELPPDTSRRDTGGEPANRQAGLQKSTDCQQENKKENNFNNNNYISLVKEPVRSAFAEFSRMRSEKGKPLTETSARLIIEKLEACSKGDVQLQIRMLLDSAEHGWTSVYPPGDASASAGRSGKKRHGDGRSSFNMTEITERAEKLPEYGRKGA